MVYGWQLMKAKIPLEFPIQMQINHCAPKNLHTKLPVKLYRMISFCALEKKKVQIDQLPCPGSSGKNVLFGPVSTFQVYLEPFDCISRKKSQKRFGWCENLSHPSLCITVANMSIRLHFFLLLLCSLSNPWISSAKLDYTNATVEVLQARRTLLRKNQSRGIRDGSLEYLTTLLNSRTKLFTTWHENLNNPFHHANEDDYVRFIRALTPWILSPPAYPSHPIFPLVLPPLPPLNCGQSRYAHVLTGQPLSQPRIIVDFIPFGYDIDKLELRLYEYYDLVDAFVVYESPKTHGGTDKILYFKQLMIQKDPRFQPFLSKVIHLSVTSTVLEPLAKLVKTALQEGDRFKLKSHSWDLEVGIHFLTVFIFLLYFHSVNKSCVSIINDPCRYVVVSIPNISHTLYSPITFLQPILGPGCWVLGPGSWVSCHAACHAFGDASSIQHSSR